MSIEDGYPPDVIDYNIDAYYRAINNPMREAFKGNRLRVGQSAPEVHLISLDGQAVDLDAVVSVGHVALVFGCISAPPFLDELALLEQLHRALPKGQSLACIYTREIHPNEPALTGTSVPPHRSMKDKITQATRLRDEYKLSMPIYVDDLIGTTHLAYGYLPEFQVVVSSDRQIMHLGEWASASQLEGIFANLGRRDEDRSGIPARFSYSETLWYAGNSIQSQGPPAVRG